jgi:holliday junction DNA helicase RuvA
MSSIMIGKLRGHVESVREDSLILDIQGVGYRVFASAQTLQTLRDTKGETSLFIETHVREDHIHLYGFLSEDEQEVFNTLTTVQGVGNKMALAVLSTFSAGDVANLILVQDVNALTRVSGIGKRIAERIVIELKNKMPSIALNASSAAMSAPPSTVSGKPSIAASTDASTLSDAISALEHLGYSRTDAHRAAYTAMQNGATALDSVIPAALKLLAK